MHKTHILLLDNTVDNKGKETIYSLDSQKKSDEISGPRHSLVVWLPVFLFLPTEIR
jgi:hypothetical protein